MTSPTGRAPWSNIPLDTITTAVAKVNPSSVGTLILAPSDPRVLYLYGNQTFVASTDGGSSWTRRQPITSLVFATGAIPVVDPADPQSIYGLSVTSSPSDPTNSKEKNTLTQSDYRIAHSNDGGQTFQELTIPPDLGVYQVPVDELQVWRESPSVPARLALKVLVGDQDHSQSAVAVSQDGGSSWQLAFTPDNMAIISLGQQSRSVLYIAGLIRYGVGDVLRLTVPGPESPGGTFRRMPQPGRDTTWQMNLHTRFTNPGRYGFVLPNGPMVEDASKPEERDQESLLFYSAS
jgi:hypothetical protein